VTEEQYILGCDDIQSGRSLPAFLVNVLPTSSGLKNKLNNKLLAAFFLGLL
jgi:hypothetical protein